MPSEEVNLLAPALPFIAADMGVDVSRAFRANGSDLMVLVTAPVRQRTLADVEMNPGVVDDFRVDVVAVLIGIEVRSILVHVIFVLAARCAFPDALRGHSSSRLLVAYKSITTIYCGRMIGESQVPQK